MEHFIPHHFERTERFGDHDVASLPDGYDCYLSIGANGSFTHDFMSRYPNLNYESAYVFDSNASMCDNVSFVRNDVNTVKIDPLLRRYHNVFVKINQENMIVLENVDETFLNSIKQLLIEVDGFPTLNANLLRKLSQNFTLISTTAHLLYVRKNQIPRANEDTIFVTCYIDFREDRGTDRKFETNLQHFSNLVRSGINLHVYVSENLYPQVMSVPGILNSPCIVVETITLEELECYRYAPGQLPNHRTTHHDTAKFLILQNAKIEIVKRAIESGRYDQSTHFAWIDFSIFHVVTETEAAVNYLRTLGHSKIRTSEVILPGCWGKVDQVDNVAWRFCGGFFLGSRAAILDMYECHKKVYRALEKLTWEVNVWARMEVRENWQCAWFKADHNDTIIRIPPEHLDH